MTMEMRIANANAASNRLEVASSDDEAGLIAIFLPAIG
jgi:hypothetical protein